MSNVAKQIIGEGVPKPSEVHKRLFTKAGSAPGVGWHTRTMLWAWPTEALDEGEYDLVRDLLNELLQEAYVPLNYLANIGHVQDLSPEMLAFLQKVVAEGRKAGADFVFLCKNEHDHND